MPAVSKKQFKFMQMVIHNKKNMKNKPKSLSSEEAKEFISHNTGSNSYNELPEKVNKKKTIKDYLKY